MHILNNYIYYGSEKIFKYLLRSKQETRAHDETRDISDYSISFRRFMKYTLSATTIANFFKEAGFRSQDCVDCDKHDDATEITSETKRNWDLLYDNAKIDFSVFEYISIDGELDCGSGLTDDEIIANAQDTPEIEHA